jgi:hypothetical protein
MFGFGSIYEKLHQAGVQLMIATEPFDDTPIGKAMAGMRAFFAEQENTDRVRRVMRAKRGRVQSGKPVPGGHDLYGYRWTDATKTQRRFDDEDSQAYRTVRRIWDYFLHDHHPSLRNMALQLNADGIPSPRAYFHMANARGLWSAESVRIILQNEEYWGGDNGMVKVWSYSQYEPEAVIPAFAPPYVTPEEAARVHARFAANRSYHGGKPAKRDWTAEGLLLHGGLARCAECGRALAPSEQRRRRRADGTYFVFYRCSLRATLGKSRCNGVALSAKVLDDAVIMAVHEHLSNSAYLRKALALRDQAATTVSGRVRELEQQLVAAEQKVKNAARFVLDRGHTDPLAVDVLAQAELTKAEIPTLQVRLARAREAVARVQQDKALQAEIIAWAEAWTDGFYMLSTAKQREFLQACGAQVRLWREGERTPRARLVITIPSSVGTYPPPMDVEANLAVYGDDAGIDEEGIFVDTDQAERNLRRPLVIVDESPAKRPISTKAVSQT